MTIISPRVPADVEPESLIDLVDDCREVSGVLGPYLPSGITLPDARPAAAVEIAPGIAAEMDGWGDYGTD